MSAGAVVRGLGRRARGLVGAVGDVVFPPSCWVTREPISRENCGLCDEVREKIAREVAWPYCRRCGSSVGVGGVFGRENPCLQCESRDLGVRSVVRVGTYAEPLSVLVKRLKFRKEWAVAGVLAPFLYQAITMGTGDGNDEAVDALVPVALHWQRRWSRGFNQSEELAREAGKLGGWPVWNVLRRVRATKEQSHLQSVTERAENLLGAFVCAADRRLAGKHVWLVDDVSTTGATIHAAATALRRLPKGVRPAEVHAAVVCVTDRAGVPHGVTKA